MNNLFNWASNAALPSSDFAVNFEETAGLSDGRSPINILRRLDLMCKPDIVQSQTESQSRSALALELLLALNKTLANTPKPSPDVVADVLLAGACFKNKANPWTTSDSHETASKLIDTWTQTTRQNNTFWPAIDIILKERIRPLFANTRNPAITSAGRKNFHPQTLPRFGSNGLDESAKPWKTTDVYVASVLSWILSQYNVGPLKKTCSLYTLLTSAARGQASIRNTLPALCSNYTSND